eukprot:5842227-Amphidinium_carterae.1
MTSSPKLVVRVSQQVCATLARLNKNVKVTGLFVLKRSAAGRDIACDNGLGWLFDFGSTRPLPCSW